MYKTDFAEIASQFKVGDHVSINWGRQSNAISGLGKECYPTRGTIVQITENSFYIRCPAGYVSGVSANHLAVGIELKKMHSAEVVYFDQLRRKKNTQNKGGYTPLETVF